MSRPLTALTGVCLLAVVVAPIAGVTAVASHGAETPAGDATVRPGDRLQAVVGVQRAEVGGDLRERAFGVAFRTAETNASKAAAIGGLLTNLEDRLERLERRKRALRAARENGTLDEGRFRAEMAVVAAETGTIRRLANQSAAASRRVPAAALRNQGVDRESIRRLGSRAANLTGPEVAAIARSIAGNRVGRRIDSGNRPNVTGPPPGAGNGNGPPGGNDTGPPERNDTGDSGKDDGNAGDGGRGAADGRGLIAPPAAGGVGLPDAPGTWAARNARVGVLTSGANAGRLAGEWASGGSLKPVSAVATAEATDGEPVFSVDLRADRAARITLRLAFDLSADSDRRAFRTMQDDEEARANVRTRFGSRLGDIANTSERRVDREMSVEDAAVSLATVSNETVGVVTLSVAWQGLAGRTDDADPHLVITEPFASGFTPSRLFTVRIVAPDRYRLTRVTPEPDGRTDASATWEAGADLTDFTLVFASGMETALPEETVEAFQPTSPTVTTSVGDGGTSGASLLVGAAIVAAVAIGGGLLWRRRSEAEAGE